MRNKALLELVCGFVTAVSSTITAVTLCDSAVTNVVRGDTGAEKIVMLPPFAFTQLTGVARIRSTGFPENAQGFRAQHKAGVVEPLAPMSILTQYEPKPNETLTIELSGSSTSGDLDMIAVPILYQNPKNYLASYIGLAELNERRMGKIQAIENTITTPTSGAWGTSEAITAEFDVLNADTDYAVVGYLTNSNILAVGYSGTVTGNYRTGGPGDGAKNTVTENWFLDLTRGTGFDLIPTFRGDAATKFFVNAVTNENGVDPVVTTLVVPIRRVV